MITPDNCPALKKAFELYENPVVFASVLDNEQHIVILVVHVGSDDGLSTVYLMINGDGSYYNDKLTEFAEISFYAPEKLKEGSPFDGAYFVSGEDAEGKAFRHLYKKDGTKVLDFETITSFYFFGNYIKVNNKYYDGDGNEVDLTQNEKFVEMMKGASRISITYEDGIEIYKNGVAKYYDYDFNEIDKVTYPENMGMASFTYETIEIKGVETKVATWGNEFIGCAAEQVEGMGEDMYYPGNMINLKTGEVLVNKSRGFVVDRVFARSDKYVYCNIDGEIYKIYIADKKLGFSEVAASGEKKAATYWYENGVKQGTYDDPKGVIGDGTVRGREIYDEETDAWYWLDACYSGAKACSKEVWMPYIYQNEADFDNAEIEANAAKSGNMASQVEIAIKKKTGKWVRYRADGSMVKGWYTVDEEEAKIYPKQAGNTYYYDHKTGLMAKGLTTIDGDIYYFDQVTGARYENKTYQMHNVIYTFGADGKGTYEIIH